MGAGDVGEEVVRWLPALAKKRSLDLGTLILTVLMAPVEWQESEKYAAFESKARARMEQRDESDWPTLALAMATKRARRGSRTAIWSQDKDFSVAGFETWTTGQLLDAMEF